jgi:hypothetical protein
MGIGKVGSWLVVFKAVVSAGLAAILFPRFR